ncbi:MAG: glucoamylase family protein [Terracidiphilus sp.]
MTQTSHARDESQTHPDTTGENLLEAARAALKWDVVLRPRTPSAFPARVAAARRALKKLERNIAAFTAESSMKPTLASPATAALRELKENPRPLRAAIAAVSGSSKLIDQLPRVIVSAHREEPRVAVAARLYFEAIDKPFSAETLSAFIHAVQEHEPFNLEELWNIGAFLRFILLEMILEETASVLGSKDAATAGLVTMHLKSLRAVGNTEWVPLIEPLIAFDAVLRQDPAMTYAAMDFDSRELYRKRVAFIARHSDCTEMGVAQAALEFAREASDHPVENPRMQRRRMHVGYYLIDKGLPQIGRHCGYHPPFIHRVRAFVRRNADYFYITAIQLLTIFFVAALILVPLPRYTFFDCLIIAVLLILPASQCAVDLVNNTVTALFDPHPLPKLNFRMSIPAEFTTLVAVPTLLLNEEQVRGLVTDLEVRYLANRDAHLHFALLTDLPDSVARPHDRDSHPLVELAVRLIDDLNAKYAARGQGYFFLLHRHRVFNRKQGVWMGWERKRGKLLDLNRLLVGEFDAFPIKAGRLEALSQIRYVLTVDSDTQMPRGTAAKLIGAIAHPLNQAIIHPTLRVVTEGFGILQPRIGVAVQSTARSRLASIYSGQSGFDIYTRAVSDAYQEMYGDGIFTGKGIYEVRTFHAVLDRRFPRNALLSHDLIEGAYARAGLVTDVELIDDYPSHYSAYTRRKHRWVRGDWQIARWLFGRVPEESGKWVPNPISEVSRWKILDNLRRSLVEPFTFILFVAGWLGLPGGPLYWTLVAVFLLIFPTLVQLVFGLSRAILSERKGGVSQAFAGFGQALLLTLLNLVFLPHQTLLAFDAIIRSLVRAFITGERLLEWETAAESEARSSRRTAVDRYLALTPLVALAIAILVYLVHPHGDHIFYAAPILLLWGFADAVTNWLNAPPREEHRRLGPADETFLLDQALRIWRYFNQFGAERHNYLIPDNVEEERLFEAARVSPTNLGMLLNARQAAAELGFLTVPELVDLTQRSFDTIARLDKYRGHLYNWYDTQTLQPIGTRMVSSVDSGNLVASLYTLQGGTLDVARRPLIPHQLFIGLSACWRMSPLHERKTASRLKLSLPRLNANTAEWLAWIPRAATSLSEVTGLDNLGDSDAQWWLSETERRIAAILALLCDYMPWLLPEYAALRELPQLEINQQADKFTIETASTFAHGLAARLTLAWSKLSHDASLVAAAEQLRASLPAATENLRELAAGLRSVAERAERMAEDTEFAFLVHPYTQMLSIGYDADSRKLHDACYDLLASEARIATFIAVARGDLPQESWFKLSRDHTLAYDRLLLLSWTGTMFEYLMPALWMRSYPHTLIARTLAACVDVQRAFANSLNIPWGISESGFARKNDDGHYDYQAFGIPAIALKYDATAGPVVSPYSTFLALGVDSIAALRNLHRIASAGWVGPFGFYEAIDFSVKSGKPVPVREWMAHHQGMSLLAVVNLLRGNTVQEWFHSIPLMQSAEIVLHEMPMSKGFLLAKLKEFDDLNSAAAA